MEHPSDLSTAVQALSQVGEANKAARYLGKTRSALTEGKGQFLLSYSMDSDCLLRTA